MGSSVMRVQQLSAHLDRHYGSIYQVRTVPIASSEKLWVQAWLATRPRGGVYFFSKDSLRGWQADDLERLRQKASALLVDYVDLELRNARPFGVDAHVMTSYAGAVAMRRLQQCRHANGERISGSVHTVLHNYDTLVDTVSVSPPDHLAIAFLGTPAAAATTPTFDDQITFLPGHDRPQFLASVRKLGRFNAHYCVRVNMPNRLDRSYAPFTKGVTAAACEAVILTNRGCDDAEALLGIDYPYMFRSIEPEALNESMRFVAESYRGPEWTEALERVMELRARTSHAAIAGQLHQTIEAVRR